MSAPAEPRPSGVPEHAYQVVLPHTEVCMELRVAGRARWVAQTSPYCAQIYDEDGRPFSAPIALGEAGLNDRGEPHTTTHAAWRAVDGDRGALEASSNVHALVRDLADAALPITAEPLQATAAGALSVAAMNSWGDGRYGFQVTYGERAVALQMPGCPLAIVRYQNRPGERVGEFYCVYVNRVPRPWYLAVGEIRRTLNPDPTPNATPVR